MVLPKDQKANLFDHFLNSHGIREVEGNIMEQCPVSATVHVARICYDLL